MDSFVDEDLPAKQIQQPFYLTIEPQQAGTRVDQLLVEYLPDTSRSRIATSIKNGLITVNGRQCKAGYKLKTGDIVTGVLWAPPPLSVEPERIEFPILFEDDSLLVISKPPDLVVHPGSGNITGTLVSGLVFHCAAISGVGDAVRPGIVHRLDKDTSGIMVVAKNSDVHRRLVELFKSRSVKKEYTAIVHGLLEADSGKVVAPVGRHAVHRQKMAVRDDLNGKYAVSNWQVLARYGLRFSLVNVRIETGRTHQIRVHMAHLNHPVAGDTLYGSGRDNTLFPRQMLHARSLAFQHPVSGDSLEFSAPLWPDMERIVESLDSHCR